MSRNYLQGMCDPGDIDYTGLESDTAKVTVDNDTRTIKVDVTDDVRSTIPKDSSGKFISGTYTMKVIVVDGKATAVWTLVSGSHPIYYGATSSDTITEDVIKSLTDGGTDKVNITAKFVQSKQYGVFSFPKDFGKLVSIIHQETGFEMISSFTIEEVEVDEVTYYAYVSGKSSGTYTYIFKFYEEG